MLTYDPDRRPTTEQILENQIFKNLNSEVK